MDILELIEQREGIREKKTTKVVDKNKLPKINYYYFIDDSFEKKDNNKVKVKKIEKKGD